MNAAELNARNRAFWSVQREALERRLADPIVHEHVMRKLRTDQMRLPPSGRETLEIIAEDVLARLAAEQVAVERAERDGVRHFSAKGGRAKKGDVLKRFIEQRVAAVPTISLAALVSALKVDASSNALEWLDEVTETEIHFASGKTVGLSSLKDRLSRAKKDARRASR